MSTVPRPHSPSNPRPPALLTYDDLVHDLVWPQLLKAAPLALRPTRVLLGMLLAGVLAIVVALANALDGRPSQALFTEFLTQNRLNAESWRRVLVDPESSAGEAFNFFFATPWQAVQSMPWVAPPAIVLLLVAWAILGGAISRTAACDYAFNRSLSLFDALGFAIRKAGSLIGATLTPLLIIWGIALAIGVLALLLRVPWLNVLAGLASGLVIAGALAASIITLAYAAGQTMLVPSVACEGSDAIDAMQRAYAFVLARPLRLVIYTLVLIVQGILLAIILFTVIFMAQRLFVSAASAWGGESGGAILSALDNAPRAIPIDEQALSADQRWTRRFIGLWTFLLFGIGVGAMLSYVWTACTLLYLAMRRVCDGQDMTDLWHERLMPGTLAAMPAPGAPAGSASSTAISDTGPADAT